METSIGSFDLSPKNECILDDISIFEYQENKGIEPDIYSLDCVSEHVVETKQNEFHPNDNPPRFRYPYKENMKKCQNNFVTLNKKIGDLTNTIQNINKNISLEKIKELINKETEDIVTEMENKLMKIFNKKIKTTENQLNNEINESKNNNDRFLTIDNMIELEKKINDKLEMIDHSFAEYTNKLVFDETQLNAFRNRIEMYSRDKFTQLNIDVANLSKKIDNFITNDKTNVLIEEIEEKIQKNEEKTINNISDLNTKIRNLTINSEFIQSSLGSMSNDIYNINNSRTIISNELDNLRSMISRLTKDSVYMQPIVNNIYDTKITPLFPQPDTRNEEEYNGRETSVILTNDTQIDLDKLQDTSILNL